MNRNMKFFLGTLAVLTLPAYAAAYSEDYLQAAFDFVAPSVPNTNSVSDRQSGLIIYDNSDSTFKGHDQGGNWVTLGGSAANANYVYLKDEKSSGTNGGTCTSGSWITRDLNVLENPSSVSWASLSANQFTLSAGTYEIFASSPGYAVDTMVTKLFNTSDSSDVIIGQAQEASAAGSAAPGTSILAGTFTISSQKTFELRFRCQTTRAANGLGLAHSWGTNVYSIVKIEKKP